MDAGTSSLLESVTLKTLHAQNFSRSSTRASHVLTDLLSRYMSLLMSTCARYAEHAGRKTVSMHDAFLALSELGITVDELVDYADGEAHELSRYIGTTSRRAEELAVLKETLREGCKMDQDDAIALVYAEMKTPPSSDISDEESEESDVDEEEQNREVYINGDMPYTNGTGPRGTKRTASPVLPPSPISKPTSPMRKRIRLQPGWDPPEHIPDFLPPFPTTKSDNEVSSLQSPQIKTEAEAALPLANVNGRDRDLPAPLPQQLSTATSAADYLTPVPYSMSSLSTTPDSHLPDTSSRTAPSPVASALQLLPRKHEPPDILPSLLAAYHHVLTNPAPSEPSINPGRHRIALTSLSQAYARPKWTAQDTLFANLAASRPRVVSPAPTFPVFLGSALGKEDKQLVIPSTLRTLMVDETVLPLSHEPMSRIPDIAKAILPYNVHTRAARLQPPPPLTDPQSQKKEKFLYGLGVPAPWNGDSNLTDAGRGGKEGADGEGKERDKVPKALEDANLFATWDWEAHDPLLPIPLTRRGRAKIRNTADGPVPASAGTITLSRKGSRAGREV